MAFLISGAILFFVQPYLASKMNEQKEFVRAKMEIKKGDKITDEMLELVKISSFQMPKELISKKELIIGKYSKDTIFAKDFFTSSKLLDNIPSKEPYLDNLNFKEGERAISIRARELSTALSGKIEAGDIVSVLAVSENESIILPSLQFVKVLAVSNDEGIDIKKRETMNDKEGLIKTVTLLVKDRQAKDVTFHEEHFPIYFMLSCRTKDEKEKLHLLKLQDEVLEQLEIEETEQLEKESIPSDSINPPALPLEETKID